MVQRASHARVALAATLLARLWLDGLRVPSARAYAHFGRRADAPAPAAAQQKLF